MNSDTTDEIAYRITQKWMNSLLVRINNSSNNGNAKTFLRHLETQGRIVFQYENQQLLDKAMDVIPLQKLYEEAEAELIEDNIEDGQLQDKIIQRLLHWFKNSFFKWVNNAPCESCGNTQTVSIGVAQPNQEELRYTTRAVEQYQCPACRRITRFPRYNNPVKLLETRRGRCGEWANCFTLFCRAVGSEARIVYDTTDHVWTEVYSEYENRWIHCDSCENAWDRPLLYNVGWNKEIFYCTAFSVEEALDVTKRYTRNWPEVLKKRTNVKEVELAIFLEDLSQRYQQGLDEGRKKYLNKRHVKELLELEADSKKTRPQKDELLPGRQSGSLAWRTSRGETGEKTSATLMVKIDHKDLQPETMNMKDEAQLSLQGNAHILHENTSLNFKGQQTIRLTQARNDQRGSVFLKQPVYLNGSLSEIDVEFAFRITDGNGSPSINGADGFAFVIQSQGENALGAGGCELGFGGIKNCLAIEFDTYDSSDRCADPSANHISVQGRLPPFANSAHHDHSLGHTSRIPTLQNGKWIKSRIRLSTKGQIEVGIAEESDAEFVQVLKIEDQSFIKYLDNKKMAWIGFTASTGGLSQNHDIQLINISLYNKK